MALSRVYVLCATVVVTIVKVHTAPTAGLLSGLFGGDEGRPKAAPIDINQLLRQYYTQQSDDQFAQYNPYGSLGSPSIGGPGLGNSGLGNPGLGNPGLGNPGLGNPGLGNPGLGNPGLGNPGLRNPGLGNLGFGGSGFGSPGFGGPGLSGPALSDPVSYGQAPYNPYPSIDTLSPFQQTNYNQGFGNPYDQLLPLYRSNLPNLPNAADDSAAADHYSKQLDSLLPSNNDGLAYADAANYRSLGNSAASELQPQAGAAAAQSRLDVSQSPVASSLISHRALAESSSLTKSAASTNSANESSAKDQ